MLKVVKIRCANDDRQNDGHGGTKGRLDHLTDREPHRMDHHCFFDQRRLHLHRKVRLRHGVCCNGTHR